jgi:hypothetical protein
VIDVASRSMCLEMFIISVVFMDVNVIMSRHL